MFAVEVQFKESMADRQKSNERVEQNKKDFEKIESQKKLPVTRKK
jgi:hypothetical protein